MNIILTGANGNLGGEMISRNATHKILPIHRNNWDAIADRSFGKDDVIVHAASDLTSAIHEKPFAVMDSNLSSTARLLEMSKGCARFVFISSCAVYGDALRTAESTRCRPLSINGITKQLNERIVEEFCLKNGIPYLILRVFNTYGGRDRFSIISKLRHAVKTGTPFQLNNLGVAQRDFIHVSDVADIVLELSGLDLPSGTLNIGTGCTTKIADIVSAVKEIHPQLEIIHNVADEVEYSRADIGRLKEIINYQFTGIFQQLPSLVK
jgi:nucleoside-diphosphate-sugar epimerase